jgi:hypothetical protein
MSERFGGQVMLLILGRGRPEVASFSALVTQGGCLAAQEAAIGDPFGSRSPGSSAGIRLGRHECSVPTISRFFGIEIRMYYEDHGPAHFHAYYAEHAGVVSVGTLAVLAGWLPGGSTAWFSSGL